ncbi:MAG TPA: immunoglobulin domain-containing protein [Candidatus Paceibacterota bacterium]|nr:immunoglobulin domain-containing protein [Verrucomicrobiota bacterium]HSA10760.1 immunoglobulin domain-containing protein [Candidatus Paceibacterota bacterium]
MMKKILLASLLSCLALVSVSADVIYYEGFNYADGYIVDVAGGNWANHSGAATGATISGQKLQNSGALAADVNRLLCTTEGCAYTNGVQILYASFTVRCATLPTSSQYFAHFKNASTAFQCRAFYLAGTQPGTWRLGIAGAAGTPNQTYPVDLATNVDYQVVVGWNPTTGEVNGIASAAAALWVNPIDSFETALVTSDAVANPPAPVAFAFRQPSSGAWVGVISNLCVATTFDEAAQSVWATNAFAPQVVYQPAGTNVFENQGFTLVAVANGQGLRNLTYQWKQNGSDVSNENGNSPIFIRSSATSGDSGTYTVVVTTPHGEFATSSGAIVNVSSAPVPPTITQQPVSTNAYYGQTVSLYCGATGPGTLSYAWYHNGNTVASEANANVSGDGTATLTIANLQSGNGTLGTYRCDVSNEYGTRIGSNAVVSASAVPTTTIYDLKGHVDDTFYLPTNTTALWSVTGVVTVYTNLTGAANMSIMIQDATGGIGVFWPGHGADRPAVGDSVTAIGTLAHFNSQLQININSGDPSNMLITNSHNNPLPTPYVLPLTFTNGVGYGGVSNVVRSYIGSRVTLTNVYFVSAPGTFGTGQQTLQVTNASGDRFTVFFNAAVTPAFSGQAIPTGPVNITAPMSYFLGSTAPDRSAGFQIIPTRYEDITTAAAAPTPVTIIGITPTEIQYSGGSGSQFVLYESTSVAAPLNTWTRTAQINPGTPGSFSITASGTQKFYSIKSE